MGRGPYETEEGKLSDERLIDAAMSGDDGAFTMLVTKYKHHVFGLAAHFARDSFELDDICQMVFIKVYEHRRTNYNQSQLFFWFDHFLNLLKISYDFLL